MNKLFHLITLAFLLITAALAYLNHGRQSTEQERLLSAQASYEKAIVKRKQTQEEIQIAKETLQEAKEALAQSQQELQEAEAFLADNEKQIESKTQELTEKEEQLAQNEESANLVDDIKQVESDLIRYDERISNAQAIMQTLKINREEAQGRLDFLDAKVEKTRTLLRAKSEGIIANKSFRSSIRAVYDEYGFVVLNAGNRAGVVTNAKLEVRRGGVRIAELIVVNVEQAFAVADIVEGTLAEGESILIGDAVIPSSVDQVNVATPSTLFAKAS